MVGAITTRLSASASFRIRRPLLRRLAHDLRPLHPRRAELELGDFSERIERRIGEQVRGRLHEGEGDEHDAVRYPVVLAGRELDRAAAGGGADAVAGLDAEPRDLAGRE